MKIEGYNMKTGQKPSPCQTAQTLQAAASNERFQDIWKELSSAFIAKFLYFSGYALDDLKQEIRLICHEISTGDRKYDKSLSSETGYIISILSGMLKRAAIDKSILSGTVDGDDIENIPAQERSSCGDFYASSSLDLMIEREEREQAEQQEKERAELLIWIRRALKPEQEWMRLLRDEGLSLARIAEIGGVSESFVFRVMKNKKIRTCVKRHQTLELMSGS